MSAFAGFAKGFFNERVKMIDAQQEKQDELAKRLKEIQLKGLEKQQELYDKKASTMAEVENFYNSGDIKSAYATLASTIAGGSVIENLKKTYGKDYEATYDSEQNRKYIEETIKNWRGTKRPEMSQEELDRIQVRKGVENLAFEQGIRNIFGIDSTEEYYGTPYKGLHETRPNMSSGVQYREKPDDDGKPKYTPGQAETDQGVVPYVMTHRGGKIVGVDYGKPIKGQKAPAELTDDAKSRVSQAVNDTFRVMDAEIEAGLNSSDPQIVAAAKEKERLYEIIKDGMGTPGKKDSRGKVKGGKPGALNNEFWNRVNNNRRGGIETEIDAARMAMDDLAVMIDLGFIEERQTGGFFSDTVYAVLPAEKQKQILWDKYKAGEITEQEASNLLQRFNLIDFRPSN